jgi:hypothetical protein
MRFCGSLTLALLLGSCSDPGSRETEAAAVTKSIRPEGGTIRVGGATVTFPAGAVAAPTTVTVAATEADAPAGFVKLSRVFECKPSGIQFARKVTVEMRFVDDGRPVTMFWSTADPPQFKDIGGRVDGDTLSVEIDHFSTGFVGRAN